MLALRLHRGQMRSSGDPYITHPIEVAMMLAQSRMDVASVVTGLLHDTVEDTALTLAELEVFVVEVTKSLARNMWPTG